MDDMKGWFNMTISEKVSYIKGLAEGLSLDETTKEGKILAAVIDVLGDIAENLNEVDEELDDVADVVTDLEESVCDLEDEVYGTEDDYDDDEDFEDDLDGMYETTCPNCGNTIRFDYDQAQNNTLDCPNCGSHLEFELDEDDAD